MQTPIERISTKVKAVFDKLSMVYDLFMHTRKVPGQLRENTETVEKCGHLSWPPCLDGTGGHPVLLLSFPQC